MTTTIATIITAFITSALTYLATSRTMQAKEREIEGSMNKIATDVVQASLKDQGETIKQLRLDLDVQRKLYMKLVTDYSEMHSGITKLNATFSGVEVHLENFLDLVMQNAEQAESYLPHLRRDMGKMRHALEELGKISEPQFDLEAKVRAEVRSLMHTPMPNEGEGVG